MKRKEKYPELLVDTDKIFRLFKLVLITLFAFCIFQLYQFFESYKPTENSVDPLVKLGYLVGVYFANGIPRFIFYLLCFIYVKYKYDGINWYLYDGESVQLVLIIVFVIAILLAGYALLLIYASPEEMFWLLASPMLIEHSIVTHLFKYKKER